MDVRIATPEDTQRVSSLSMSLGNVPFLPNQSVLALLERNEEIVGFAAVQSAQHAAGSWVKEELRHKGYTYQLRNCLDNELRRRGFGVYFALPQDDFEKQLFAKYGRVTERIAQVRYL